MLTELRKNSPDTVFVPVTGAIPDNCDYYFEYLLNLIGAGRDIKVAEDLYGKEYTAYWMQSTLAGNEHCGYPGWVLDVEITKNDRDLHYSIRRNIKAYGDIGKRIEEFEKSHPTPPRGPVMEESLDRESVSPLKKETELKIKIDIKNCKGEVVYDKYHGHRVILKPRVTERGEIKPTRNFPQNHLVLKNSVILFIVRPVGASATYTLKKGVEAGSDQVTITTCGVDKKIVKEVEIPIAGLNIKVTPKRKIIMPGESTRVEIKLNKVDPEGNKTPVPGRKVKITIKGLIDGKVTPPGDVTTDNQGQATLAFKAGEQDKKVWFQVNFQPQGFTESVQNQAKVEVAFPEVYARITKKHNYHNKYHDDSRYGVVKKGENNETRRLTVFVEFEKKPEIITQEFDRTTMSLKPIRLSYKVKRYAVQSSSYENTGTSFHSWSHREEYRQSSFTESGSVLKLKERNPGTTMIMNLDIKSNRIHQVSLPDFEATLHITGHHKYTFKELYKGTRDCSIGDYERKGKFGTSIPGDAKNCDIVSGGDGKTSLTGECRIRHERKQSFDDYFYSWEVKIKK